MAKKKVFSIGNALSQGLEETIKSAQHYSGELRVDIIPIKKIELDPDNPRDLSITIFDIETGLNQSDPEYLRKEREFSSLQSIAHSIATQGLINPITVYKFGEQYRLISGERRTLASVIAGKSDIQAKILDEKPDHLKISLLQWIENIERSDLSLHERLSNLEKIVNSYAKSKQKSFHHVSIKELSQLIGCVQSHAMNYRSLLNADHDLKKLIFENKIRNLEKAALIAAVDNEQQKNILIQACIDGATLKQLKKLCEDENKKIKTKLFKPLEKRGRQSTLVNFGVTKNIDVAKTIIQSLLQKKELSKFNALHDQIDWTNYRIVSDTFKKLISVLERVYK